MNCGSFSRSSYEYEKSKISGKQGFPGPQTKFEVFGIPKNTEVFFMNYRNRVSGIPKNHLGDFL